MAIGLPQHNMHTKDGNDELPRRIRKRRDPCFLTDALIHLKSAERVAEDTIVNGPRAPANGFPGIGLAERRRAVECGVQFPSGLERLVD